MPRYFFDIRDDGVLDPDEVGKDFPDLHAAIGYGQRAFSQRRISVPESGQQPALRIEIRDDAAGIPVFIIDAESASLPRQPM